MADKRRVSILMELSSIDSRPDRSSIINSVKMGLRVPVKGSLEIIILILVNLDLLPISDELRLQL